MHLILLFPLIISLVYALGLFIISNMMKTQSSQLRDTVRKKLTINFLERSVNFLTESEFSDLMDEISLLPNLKNISEESLVEELSKEVGEKAEKMRKELNQLIYYLNIISKIDAIANSLYSRSRLLKIVGIILVILALPFVFFEFNYIYPVSLYYSYIVIGIFVGLIFYIIESLVEFYRSEKITKVAEN
ncbi:hypothetical protein SJAV_27570 [Sulfurisphaera javensis]|uniref:Uncharacterized protein n=1 Tax=Sulfurisphaera javensis TaxID=2049879 RepID=A0AAT9GVQ4_9CREN